MVFYPRQLHHLADVVGGILIIAAAKFQRKKFFWRSDIHGTHKPPAMAAGGSHTARCRYPKSVSIWQLLLPLRRYHGGKTIRSSFCHRPSLQAICTPTGQTLTRPLTPHLPHAHGSALNILPTITCQYK
jgi:hypothetical protein